MFFAMFGKNYKRVSLAINFVNPGKTVVSDWLLNLKNTLSDTLQFILESRKIDVSNSEIKLLAIYFGKKSCSSIQINVVVKFWTKLQGISVKNKFTLSD